MSAPRRVAYLTPNEMALLLRFRERRDRAQTEAMRCRHDYDDKPGAEYWDQVVTAIIEQDAQEDA